MTRPGSAPLATAVGLPNVGIFGSPDVLVDLARRAERAGWGAVAVWDHLLYHDPSWPVADPLVVASAIATATRRIRIKLLMLALPRRRPGLLARQLLTLDHLSEGRLTVGAALGSMAREYEAFGEDADPRVRARLLDANLAAVDGLLRGEEVHAGDPAPVRGVRMVPGPLQRPRPPIWIGGSWPHRRPFRRAARWDGMVPTHVDHGKGETMPADVLAEVVTTVRGWRRADPALAARPFDVAVEGATAADDPRTAPRLQAYAAAGATWWIEALGWWRGDLSAACDRVDAGPPRAG